MYNIDMNLIQVMSSFCLFVILCSFWFLKGKNFVINLQNEEKIEQLNILNTLKMEIELLFREIEDINKSIHNLESLEIKTFIVDEKKIKEEVLFELQSQQKTKYLMQLEEKVRDLI